MSSDMVSRRPRMPYPRSTSSSLDGMEKSIPKPSPVSDISLAFMALASISVNDKPLPPIPRRPSSTYSTHIDGTIIACQKFPEKRTITSHKTLQPTIRRSSTLTVPVMRPSRPKLTRDPKYHASDTIVERRRTQHKNLAEIDIDTNPMPSLNTATFSSPALSQPKKARLSNNDDDRMRIADEHANNYQSVLHNRSSTLLGFTPDPYSDQDPLATPMSPRITEVIDQSLVPPPLRFNTPEERSRPSSRFSSESEAETVHSSISNSLKQRARKVLHLQSSPSDHTENLKPYRIRSPGKSLSSSRRGSRVGSAVKQRQACIQKGISDMYDNLAQFSATSPTMEPTIKTTKIKHTHIHRERRSPAIPITPYQKLGCKSWESDSKPSKTSRWFKLGQSEAAGSSSCRQVSEEIGGSKRFISLTPTRNLRLASASHNSSVGKEYATELSRVNIKRTKSELQKGKPKKNIVLIGIGDENFKGNESGWI